VVACHLPETPAVLWSTFLWSYQITKKLMDTPRVSDIVVEKIEQLILEGTLKPGQRLPAERKFAQQMGVSRPSLREALQKLSARGMLVAKRGGGTTVTKSLNPALENPLLELISNSPDSHADVLELRHAIESLSAYYAASRRTESDIEQIRTCYKRLIISHSLQDAALEAKADAHFHLAIAEASHNVVLVHVMRSLFSLLRKSIRYNLENVYKQSGRFEHVRDQHYHLMTAIINGEPDDARSASDRHIDYIERVLIDTDSQRQREARANRRALGVAAA
jgi:GntR family transcriptional repressor for pyruvate dehydrogenase complex